MIQVNNVLDNNNDFNNYVWNSTSVKDFYLSFTSEEEANTILFTETIVNEDSGSARILPPTAEGYTVDVLGFTEQYPTQYLVNLTGADTNIWEAYRPSPPPEVPIRVFLR